jgi:hypothetical protein
MAAPNATWHSPLRGQESALIQSINPALMPMI